MSDLLRSMVDEVRGHVGVLSGGNVLLDIEELAIFGDSCQLLGLGSIRLGGVGWTPQGIVVADGGVVGVAVG